MGTETPCWTSKGSKRLSLALLLQWGLRESRASVKSGRTRKIEVWGGIIISKVGLHFNKEGTLVGYIRRDTVTGRKRLLAIGREAYLHGHGVTGGRVVPVDGRPNCVTAIVSAIDFDAKREGR